jgi:indolepyruvate ferredoxin oxidoreductase alpha subunit
LAAIHAGIGGAFSYPGTPATEIFEYIADQTRGTGRVWAEWSANEKVAYEEALGMSYAGRRAVVSMKHVGLNVAADPFVNSALTGVNGGVVLIVADDPGMHSSQNEQDSRFYGEFAQIPVFEPCNQQEAYDVTREAFEVSERFSLPVMVRLVTRLAHSRATVRVRPPDADLAPGTADRAIALTADRAIALTADRAASLTADRSASLTADASASLTADTAVAPGRRSAALTADHSTSLTADPSASLRAGTAVAHKRLPLPDPGNWTLVPANARLRFRRLLDVQPQLREWSDKSPRNELTLVGRRGVIAAGIAYNYVREVLGSGDDCSVLKIGTYPLPAERIRGLVDHCDDILVIEEGYPFIESRLIGPLGLPGKAVRGKLTGDLSLDGELTPDAVAAALGQPLAPSADEVPDLTARPPALCRGCPHADTFQAIIDATAGYAEPILFSDIGCYTLGVLPPYRAVHSCVDMGASIAMAHGAAQAGAFPVLCTIGDSTFTHSGMTPLLGAIRSNARMTVFVLDNGTVAMTGGQDTLLTGTPLLEMLKGLGVPAEHLHVIEPLPKNHEQNVALVRRALEHRGLSVIVAQRACIHSRRRDNATGAAATATTPKY